MSQALRLRNLVASLLDRPLGGPADLLGVARALVNETPEATLDDIIDAMRDECVIDPARRRRAAEILGSGAHRLNARRPGGDTAAATPCAKR